LAGTSKQNQTKTKL